MKRSLIITRPHKESRKKSSFLSGRATKRGGGLNGCATKEKITFFNVRGKVPMATRPLRKELFCGFPKLHRHLAKNVYKFLKQQLKKDKIYEEDENIFAI